MPAITIFIDFIDDDDGGDGEDDDDYNDSYTWHHDFHRFPIPGIAI